MENRGVFVTRLGIWTRDKKNRFQNHGIFKQCLEPAEPEPRNGFERERKPKPDPNF